MPFGVLIEQAITARLTCLLADWLTRDGHAERLPRTMRDFLQTQLRAGRHRWRLHHRETARVVAALGEQGIPAAAINGIAAASLLYDGRGTRQYTDADILIPPGAKGAATRVLASLGYAPAGESGTLRRDLGDPMVPSLTVDLTSRLAHADSTTTAALARRVTAPAWPDTPEPLPVLARSDAFAHTLARLATRPRWPGLADALRYALTSDPATPSAAGPPPLSPAALAGWGLVLRCWPELPACPPLSGPVQPETP